jgi:hypothetical protein
LLALFPVGDTKKLFCPKVIRVLMAKTISEIIFFMLFCFTFLLFTIRHNGWRLCKEANLGAQNCQPARKFDWNTELHLTTAPPIS